MNKTAIITGASKGIGLATAQRFLEEGWNVINFSRSPCNLHGVENITLDLSHNHWQGELKKTLNQRLANQSQLALVHNAASLEKDTVINLQAENLRQVLEVNVIAPTVLNQALLPSMAKGSAIIYIGSTLSEMAVANTASYCISKHALAGLMRSTCQDLSGTGIHTACVCPGVTDTDMLRQHVQHKDEVLNTLAAANAAKRLVKPEEIAGLVFYCATNPVVNGSMIHANLGQLNN